ncbi:MULTISPECIES: hypothetical protein [Methanobacterium]|jgi:hypothetical protein|uniref:Uncharacterized protein n=1 Tax=Methanobacterium bryantii TaxID=2161 RepID=A0A2A2H5V3_METBR|nr:MULTISPECIES: hypothetical protein [Methanobacterium]OEC88706.1 hypothetical protein A9507_03210 [Methanobacterium sp. A39]PAV04715.1 hypothetical protein ASJ80_10375 [Methanobacterium bryantii]
MGELSDALDEFSEISREFHARIQKILRDKYCWKCPMRSTSKNTFCNELDAWIRLTGAFERGVQDNMLNNVAYDELEIITSRYLFKLLKKHKRHLKCNKTTILKLKEDVDPFALKEDLLFIEENPESVKTNDLILWPQICPVSFYWFSKAKILGIIPFKILKVEKSFQKEGHKFVQVENSLEIPLEYITGKLIKIISKNDPVYSKLDL